MGLWATAEEGGPNLETPYLPGYLATDGSYISFLASFGRCRRGGRLVEEDYAGLALALACLAKDGLAIHWPLAGWELAIRFVPLGMGLLASATGSFCGRANSGS